MRHRLPSPTRRRWPSMPHVRDSGEQQPHGHQRLDHRKSAMSGDRTTSNSLDVGFCEIWIRLKNIGGGTPGFKVTLHGGDRDTSAGEHWLAAMNTAAFLNTANLLFITRHRPRNATADRFEVQHLMEDNLVGTQPAFPGAILELEVDLLADGGVGHLRQRTFIATCFQTTHNLPNVLKGCASPNQFGSHHQREQVDESIKTDTMMGGEPTVDGRRHQSGLRPIVDTSRRQPSDLRCRVPSHSQQLLVNHATLPPHHRHGPTLRSDDTARTTSRVDIVLYRQLRAPTQCNDTIASGVVCGDRAMRTARTNRSKPLRGRSRWCEQPPS